MSIFAKIRGAKKAADEHRKSQLLKELDVPKTPYKHVPTHAATDALHVSQPSGEVLRDQIKEQYKRRSELGPTRPGSDMLISHAAYRQTSSMSLGDMPASHSVFRQNSATSLGDISIGSMLLQPPPSNSLKPAHPAKMNQYRYSGYYASTRSRPPFTTSASGTSLSKGRSPLSTMTNSINELPEEGPQQEDSPVESSKRSTKSLSSSSSEGLEIRYSTPGPSVTQTSVPHTRATSVASRADSRNSRKPHQLDIQHVDEPQRSKSFVNLVQSPIAESASSPKFFDAELEVIETHNAGPDQPADQPADQRMSTPTSHVSTITPIATPKRSDDDWITNYSTPTLRKSGKNFSRPTIVQKPNSPPRLEMPIEQEEHFERLDLGIPPELISVGHVSVYAEATSPESSQARKTMIQSSYGIIQDTQLQRLPTSERQEQQASFSQRRHPTQQPQQYGQKPQVSQNIPFQAQIYDTPKQPNDHTKSTQDPYKIPYPKFSPRETISAERPIVRNPSWGYYQRRIDHQQPMLSQQQDHFPPQQVQPSHPHIQENPETFAPRQPEEVQEYERRQAYQQLSANDPSQHFSAQGNSRIANQVAGNSISPKSPTVGRITYTRVVTPVMNDSQQIFEQTSPMVSPSISPTRSPMISPVRNHSRHVDIFDQILPNAVKISSSETELPRQPEPAVTKKEKRKSRNVFRRLKKGSSIIS